jgi:MarR-like DNA-binding transcriptional regulator SgrR of sgrS sRNA
VKITFERCNKILKIIGGAILAVTVGLLLFFQLKQKVDMQPKVIVTAFSRVKSLPDPANIFTTSEWYFLNHVSSALVSFNHREGRFNPLLANDWVILNNIITFHLAPNASFSDGSPILSKDVEYSIKRLILKRSSTHFPIWEQLSGCGNLQVLDDICSGIKTPDDRTISFVLAQDVESFFLLMASPEGGIWHWSDINPKTLEIKPTRFSGPYTYHSESTEPAMLKKNQLSPIHRQFPDSPDLIKFYSAAGSALEDIIKDNKIDLYMEPVRPFFSKTYEQWGYQRKISVLSTILYLSMVGNHKKKIGRSFFQALWKNIPTNDLTAAESVLPFGSLSAISKEEFLASLPEHSSSETIHVAILTPYFRPELADLLRQAAKASQTSIEVSEVDFDTWVGLHGKQEADNNFDFVFTIYVASERYPSVQIRFLLDGRVPPFDISNLDQPNYSPERKALLAKLENWMISSQSILPLFFTRTHIIHKPNIDLGDQPISDAEIQLWRVKKSAHE